MIQNPSDPRNTKCDWCGLEITIADSWASVRVFATYTFEPSNDGVPEREAYREEKLFFCNHSHKQEYLYGM